MKTRRVAQVMVLSAVFGGGFLCGSVVHRPADAQFKELGEAAAQKAGGSGGALGSVVEMGTTLVNMQQQVDGLQKNLEVLKKVKAALGG